MGHFNKLSPAEAERLSILAEECGEVIQVIGKILRHGYSSKSPHGGPDNRKLLTKEIGDVKLAITLLTDSHDIDESEASDFFKCKMFSLPKYLHHNKHLFPDYHYSESVHTDEGAR